MGAIPFVTPLDDPRYGEAVEVSPLVRRVIARNPGKYSYTGTGTYIVGRGDVVVIDPGPVLDDHRDALIRALDGERVRAILVTHCHSDHSPLSAWLREATGAPTIAFGPHGDTGEPDDDDLDPVPPTPGDADAADAATARAGQVEAGHEESVDTAFVPDVAAADGDVVYSDGRITLEAVHTPGHTSNHLCFSLREERALFTGDHVMGWSTTVVVPPDGDMAHYMASLRRVQERDDAVLWPTHGNPVTDPAPYVAALLSHREERHAQVRAAVQGGPTRIRDIVNTLYADVRPELHKPAARSVLAHLALLVAEGLVTTADGGEPRLRSTYHPVG